MRAIFLSAAVIAALAAATAHAEINLESFAGDTGFVIDSAARCNLPTAPIEVHFDRYLANRGVAASERQRLIFKRELARGLAKQGPDAVYPCSKVREMLSHL